MPARSPGGELAPGQSRVRVKTRCPESSRTDRTSGIRAERERRTETRRRARRCPAGRFRSTLRVTGKLFLAVPDAATHAALLAPHFATSFASSTTGHAFSSGVSERRKRLVRDKVTASGIDQRADSIRKSIKVSRPTLDSGEWSVVSRRKRESLGTQPAVFHTPQSIMTDSPSRWYRGFTFKDLSFLTTDHYCQSIAESWARASIRAWVPLRSSPWAATAR